MFTKRIVRNPTLDASVYQLAQLAMFSVLLGLSTVASQPAQAQLALPYFGSVSTSNTAFFVTNTSNGNGVVGESSTGVGGTFVSSASGDGVYGLSVSGYGVHGYSYGSGTAGLGVYGNGGLYSIGVTGTSTNNAGVYGYSETGVGVVAGANTGVTTGGQEDAIFATGNFYVTDLIESTSDARYKTHITTLPNALDRVLALTGVTYDWRTDRFPNMHFGKGRQIGFIAQQVQKIVPEVVSKDTKGYLALDYSKFTPLLVEAIKARQHQVVAEHQQSIAENRKLVALQDQVRQDRVAIGENTRLKAELANQEARLTCLEAGRGSLGQATAPANGSALGALLLGAGTGGSLMLQRLRRKSNLDEAAAMPVA